MTPWLDDGDVRLYHGDVIDTLAGLQDESVDCVVTSPPYWSLRDYQVDGQIGLEETPDLYVERIVAVFREVRRVLAAHGTCWVNLGDSYATTPTGNRGTKSRLAGAGSPAYEATLDRYVEAKLNRPAIPAGLKPKDLVGIPWRVAFALQADGWWLRADIIWAKPNPMPESVTDRPTKSHEYVFLLTKQPRYFFDQEAVREPHSPDGRHATLIASNGAGVTTHENYEGRQGGERWPNAGRNVRSVWTVATQPYPEAHFATYPEELVRRCVLAGCPERVCTTCGKPSERIVETVSTREQRPSWTGEANAYGVRGGNHKGRTGNWGSEKEEVGWTNCECQIQQTETISYATNAETNGTSKTVSAATTDSLSVPSASKWRPGVVLDPFVGSGTTCKVARDHGRHSIGIDLSADYLELAARRLQQLSLLTQEPA